MKYLIIVILLSLKLNGQIDNLTSQELQHKIELDTKVKYLIRMIESISY